MVELLKACSMLKYPKIQDLKPKMVKLGPKLKQKLLILDMDETMLHTNFFTNKPGEQETPAGLQVVNGVLEFTAFLYSDEDPDRSLRLNVKIRQHLEDVMTYLSNMYEICVFTAGEQAYADTILDFIDADYSIIKHRLYRQHCTQPAPGVYVKDLRVITDREMKDMVIVDNSIVSFAFQMQNGVPIQSFTGQPDDEELLFMVTLLEEIYSYDDIRTQLEQRFKLGELMKSHGQVMSKDQKAGSNAEKDQILQAAIASQQMNNAASVNK